MAACLLVRIDIVYSSPVRVGPPLATGIDPTVAKFGRHGMDQIDICQETGLIAASRTSGAIAIAATDDADYEDCNE